jgi:prepilin-type N-terminal cleavage/methylation domain-containing protein
MKQKTSRQRGLSLIELLIAVTLAGILIAGMQGLVGLALNAESSTRARNDSLQQGRFAMRLMVKSVRMTRRLMIPLGENPNTVYSESERDVLAVTMDPTLDRDKDGWADANNDKDYLDINNNGNRDAGEPERVDEDTQGDMTNDNKSGIILIDDDGDGNVDESPVSDDDEDSLFNEDKLDGIDNDNDGSIDEDMGHSMRESGASGILGFDDDYDGSIDEGDGKDDDEDGSQGDDWLDPVVYFLNGTTLVQRVPNINPTDGTDYQENPIAENVKAFKVIRIPQGGGRSVLVDITLEITSANGEIVNFNTSVGVGSGL